jgi:predicted Rossmann-fold nucleotide-binding protein
MSKFRQLIGHVMLQLRLGKRVVGWSMTPDETISYFKGRGKMILTFYGYSGMGYEDEHGMLQTARQVLNQYHPEKTIVMIGATSVGVGAVYRVAKANGFETAGIVTSEALEYPNGISNAVDHICFINDTQYGGKLSNSDELSPTSKAMVACSDILVAIGGGDISRDELLEGKKQGKPIQFFPADMNHEHMIRYAKRLGQPEPESFMGSVHEVFGK